jgi:hypothetical protein
MTSKYMYPLILDDTGGLEEDVTLSRGGGINSAPKSLTLKR